MKITYGAIVQSAGGRFGGTVHSNWKGVQLVRRFAKPSNPNSTDQVNVRTVFRNLTRIYTLMPPYTKASWQSWVVGKQMIARNKVIGTNVPLLKSATDLAAFLPTPGDSSTLPPSDYTPSGGAGQITSTVAAPTPPAGWTIARAVLCCINASGDPTGDIFDADAAQMYEGSDTTDPYAPSITGLAAGTYYTWAFLVWTAPDNSTRYSAPITAGTSVVS